MSQDPEPLVLWKHEPKPQNPRPLETWARIRRPPCKHILYLFKKKKNLHAWTTFGPDPPTKRYVGNHSQDSVHILIHNMTICIFIYMHSLQLNIVCKIRYLFNTLTSAFQALSMRSILLTPNFATRIYLYMEGKRVISHWKYASWFWSLDP